MNIIVMSIFLGSVGYVFMNYSTLMAQQMATASPLTNIFFPIMVLWSLCLAYFFGFFGISFLDTDALSHSPSSFGLSDLQAEAENVEKERRRQSRGVYEPRNDTPICAERPAPKVSESAPPLDDSDIDYNTLSDDEILGHLNSGALKDYQLEKKLGDYERAVGIRRQLYEQILDKKLDLIPYTGYDYNKVFGANCEIVVGYVPIPVGIVGPLVLNGEPVYVPMATTEGCLVASTNRGCKAISASGGCFSVLLKDAITRAPCMRLPSGKNKTAM